MRKIILGAAIVLGSILLGASYLSGETPPADSGTYATVHVIEKATRVIIRTTIEGEESKAINVKSGYVEEEDMVNYKPVLDELARLRSLGYELQNSSISTISYGKKTISRPYHAYVFIKK